MALTSGSPILGTKSAAELRLADLFTLPIVLPVMHGCLRRHRNNNDPVVEGEKARPPRPRSISAQKRESCSIDGILGLLIQLLHLCLAQALSPSPPRPFLKRSGEDIKHERQQDASTPSGPRVQPRPALFDLKMFHSFNLKRHRIRPAFNNFKTSPHLPSVQHLTCLLLLSASPQLSKPHQPKYGDCAKPHSLQARVGPSPIDPVVADEVLVGQQDLVLAEAVNVLQDLVSRGPLEP